MNRIISPIDNGFIAKNRENAETDTKIINIDRSIYNYESCTHSLNFKGLSALYTNL
jgi:hypothetical protein